MIEDEGVLEVDEELLVVVVVVLLVVVELEYEPVEDGYERVVEVEYE